MKGLLQRISYVLLILNLGFIRQVKANTDSLVYYADLSFSNLLEKKAFEQCKNYKKVVEYSDLMMYMNAPVDMSEGSNYKEILEKFVLQTSNKIKGLEEKELVAFIQKEVAVQFLKKYKAQSQFKELFQSGTYDVTTAIELYALVFSSLGVDFEIRESGNQLKLIIYPQSSKTVVAFDSSATVFMNYDKAMVANLVRSMFYAGFIPEDEYKKASPESNFEKYFFKDTILSFRELLSLHYANLIANSTTMPNSDEALKTMQKGYFLHGSKRNTLLLKYYTINALGSKNYNESFDIDKLVLLCRMNNNKEAEISNDFIETEHKRMLEIQLQQEFNPYLESYQKKISDAVSNIGFKNLLNYNYHLQSSQVTALKSLELPGVMEHLLLAYKAMPRGKSLESYTMELFSRRIINKTSAEEVYPVINEFESHFDFLKGNKSFMRVKSNVYLEYAQVSINKGAIDVGLDYIKKSEAINKSLTLVPEANYVEKGYMTAARYFFNAGNREKAKEYLQKGNALAPESQLIKDKLKMFK